MKSCIILNRFYNSNIFSSFSSELFQTNLLSLLSTSTLYSIVITILTCNSNTFIVFLFILISYVIEISIPFFIPLLKTLLFQVYFNKFLVSILLFFIILQIILHFKSLYKYFFNKLNLIILLQV